ncbi:HisG-domain-containing protein [Peniophora sp. CONT]|nr:HisG-domain-containing protein [Peniophora sp. CONT]
MSMLNAESLKDRLLFAIPKKGRLHEKCLELLAGADIQFRRHNRLDVALVKNHPDIALVFLPASDIPSFVGKGNVDLGITGQDVIREANMQDYVTEVQPLGFGRCKLQVQVPIAAVPPQETITTVDKLAGKRIVTSFEVLAAEYFAPLDAQHGTKTSIEYVGGSVEAACNLGLADGIVDLVESGDTMRAAGLTDIATLMTSEATLIKSATPKNPSHTPIIEKIAARIKGVIAAREYVVCEYNVTRAKLPLASSVTPGRRAPTVSPLESVNGEEWVAVSAMVLKKDVANVMDQLVEIGAEDILIFNLDNCRV